MAKSPVEDIRRRLLELPDLGAASADRSPNLEEMYAPSAHAGALDPERALVVGGRGVGKSFWSSVLNDPDARNKAAKYYPKLNLTSLVVSLGFHENVRGSESVPPTKRALSKAIEEYHAFDVWRSVLLRALIDAKIINMNQMSLREALHLASENSDRLDDILIKADTTLLSKKKCFLLVFDALDRMSTSWDEITELTQGIAQLALDLRAYGAIRAKFFMRRDQFDNGEAFRFRDASKLTNNRIELFWAKDDLFGWLYQWLWRGNIVEFQDIVSKALRIRNLPDEMPEKLSHDEDIQRLIFAELAGPYMGADRRRGMTDRKIVNSLADTYGETSLRSFSAAIKTAAEDSRRRNITVRALDHLALNEGIVKASSIRLRELEEDHGWIEPALAPLRGLTVPCDRNEIITRWRADQTIKKIKEFELGGGSGPSTPISFNRGANEGSLFDALEAVGVMEIRKDLRVNVPDLFRVAAGMGRRGGVKSARGRK